MATSKRSDKKNPEVAAWLERLEHPKKDVIIKIRDIILDADGRVDESIKWSTPTFAYKGNIASINPQAKKFVSLMFHRGSEIPCNHPRLEGDAALVRTMRFADLDELQEGRADIEAVVRAWCDSKDA